jgi:hypothetical protein
VLSFNKFAKNFFWFKNCSKESRHPLSPALSFQYPSSPVFEAQISHFIPFERNDFILPGPE